LFRIAAGEKKTITRELKNSPLLTDFLINSLFSLRWFSFAYDIMLCLTFCDLVYYEKTGNVTTFDSCHKKLTS